MPLPAPLACCLAALALLPASDTLLAQDTGGIQITASPGSLFSVEEIARARRIAAENQARREAYIRAGVDDDIIVLEPYVVEGDSSLLLARLRREMERSVGSRMRPRIALEPSVLAELNLRRKFDNAFFSGPNPGAPRDAVPTGNVLGLGIGIGRALWEKRAGDIFRAPDEGSDP